MGDRKSISARVADGVVTEVLAAGILAVIGLLVGSVLLSTALAAVGGCLVGLGLGYAAAAAVHSRVAASAAVGNRRWRLAALTVVALGGVFLAIAALTQPDSGEASDPLKPPTSSTTSTAPGADSGGAGFTDASAAAGDSGASGGEATADGGGASANVTIDGTSTDAGPDVTVSTSPGSGSAPTSPPPASTTTTRPAPTTMPAPTTTDPRVVKVIGTGGLGLAIRSDPSTDSDANVVGRLPENTEVTILCQTEGQEVVAGDAAGQAFSTRVWNLVNGGYISDAFVTTPLINDYSPGIPRC
jgi:hypothetical protein